MAVTIRGFGISPTDLAISAGLLVVGTVYGFLRGRPAPESPFETTRRLQETHRGSDSASQRVIGNARTGGVVFAEADRQWPKTGGADSATDLQQTRYLYSGRLLSEGPIAGIQAVYYDDLEVPMVTVPPSGWRSTPSAHDVRIEAFYTRLSNLIPGSVIRVPATSAFRVLQHVVDASTTDPVARRLWWDVRAEQEALARSRDFSPQGAENNVGYYRESGWRQTWRAGTAPGLRVSWGNGTDADALITAQAVARARAKFPGWRDSDIVKGISWAFAEFRLWARENDQEQLELAPFPPNTVPNLEFLVRGDPAIASSNPAHGANPVKVAEKLLTEWLDDPIPADRLVGFTAAAAVCDQLITIPAVSVTDPATPTSALPITGPQVLADLYPDGLPSTAWQTRVLAEWNLREAGAANARPRYSANGILDGGMSRNDILDGLGACMGGAIVEIGGKWYARPGETRAPVLVVVEENPAADEAAPYGGPVTWQPDAGAGQAPNAITAQIAQDRERGWSESDVPAAEDDVLIDRDGRYEQDIGGLSLVNDLLDARRLLHLYLRRDAYGLRRAGWTMNVPRADHAAANLVPEDIVTLQADGLNLRMRLISVQYGNGVVRVEAVESPPDVFEPTFVLPTTARDFTVQPILPEDIDLRLQYEAVFRPDGNAGVNRLDIIPALGADVGSLRIRVTATHVRGAMSGTAVSYDYVVGSAPASGTAITVLEGTGMAIDPTAEAAGFTQSDEWNIVVAVTSYSERPYTATGAGVDEGPTITKILKGPGLPGTGVGGLDVVYDRILRPDTIQVFLTPVTLPRFIVAGLRTVPDTAQLLWRFSNEDAWRTPVSETAPPTGRNWFLQSRVADGATVWDFNVADLFAIPANVDAVLFAARGGSPRALSSPGTPAKVADITGAELANEALVAMATSPSGVLWIYSQGPGSTDKFYTLDKTTGALTKVGADTNVNINSIWFDGTQLKAYGSIGPTRVIFNVDTATGATTQSVALSGITSAIAIVAAVGGQLHAFIPAGTGAFQSYDINAATGAATGLTNVTPATEQGVSGMVLRGAADDFMGEGVLLLFTARSSGGGRILRYVPGETTTTLVATLPSVTVPAERGVPPRGTTRLNTWDGLAMFGDEAYVLNPLRELWKVSGLVTPAVDERYSQPLSITLAKDVVPAQANRIVTAKPTTRGLDGQMAWTVETE